MDRQNRIDEMKNMRDKLRDFAHILNRLIKEEEKEYSRIKNTN